MSRSFPAFVLACAAAAGSASLPGGGFGHAQALVAMELGSKATREIAGDRVDEFRVDVASAGTFLRFAIAPKKSTLVAELLLPDGALAHRALADTGFSPRSLSYVAEAPGSYRLLIRLQDPRTEKTAYEVRLEELCPATVQHRERAKAESLMEAARPLTEDDDDAVVRGALKTLGQARALYHGAGDRRGESDVLDVTAWAHVGLGEGQLAFAAMRERITMLRSFGDMLAVADAVQVMRWFAQQVGDYQAMLEFAQEALDLYRAVGDFNGIINGWMGVGNAYSALNDAERAAEAFDRADAVNPLPTRPTTNLGLAAVQYAAAGLKGQAIERYETAIANARTTGRPAEEATMLSRVAALYAELGRRDTSLAYVDRVLAYWQAQQRDPDADTLVRLGRTFGKLGDHDKAVDFVDRAVAAKPGGTPQSLPRYRDLGGPGGAYAEIGEYEKALKCFEQTLSFVRQAGNAPNREARIPARMAAAERELGRIDEAVGHVEQALAKFESLRGTIASPAVRTDYLSSIQDVYELYIDLLMRRHGSDPTGGHAAAALRVSEQARGRGLVELLAEARVDIRRGVDPALLEQERALGRRIGILANRLQRLPPGDRSGPRAASLAKEIDARTRERALVEGRIRTASPRYAALTMPAPLDVAAIQRDLLDADTLLLEFALGDPHSYLWVVSRETLSSFTLPPRAQVDAAARRVYDVLTERNRRVPGESAAAWQARLERAQAEFPRAAARLGDIVLGPAARLLGRKRLFVVPQGSLQYVPFAALPDPAAAAVTGSRSPLAAAHEILYLPSASALAALRNDTLGRPPAPRAVAVLADPVFDPEDDRVTAATGRPAAAHLAAERPSDEERSFDDVGLRPDGRIPRLIFSRREAEAVIAGVPKGQFLEALGFRASRDTALSAALSRYRIIHFATHGLLNSSHAALSGLVLSLVDEHGAARDGFLRLNDVFNLNLPADLVVLSACQTALGQDVRGEGLVGLTRGFMYAGAARVAASLWKVNDVATAELMARFYRQMRVQGLRPAAALRSAQLSMSRESRWHDPYYWAAFQMQGDWR